MQKYIILFFLVLFLLYNELHSIIVPCDKGITLLQSDDDNFFSRFSKNDFIARNINSMDDYKNKINNTVISPTISQIIMLYFAIKDINSTIFKDDWFDNNKFHKLKWKIIIVGDKNYENGYSHTRFDCIILHKDNLIPSFIHKILLHEQLHIYQKTYKQDMKKYLDSYYVKIPMSQLSRANPDTDGCAYKDKKGNIYKCEYQNIPSFNNVRYYPINKAKYEHPYELLAYNSAEKYFGF